MQASPWWRTNGALWWRVSQCCKQPCPDVCTEARCETIVQPACLHGSAAYVGALLRRSQSRLCNLFCPMHHLDVSGICAVCEESTIEDSR